MQMPPGSAMPSKSRGDIDAVAEDVVALDQHVAEVDPDAEQHAPVRRYALVALLHRRLHGDRAFDRIDHRGKLDQHAVARGLDDAATMLRHQRVRHDAALAQRAGGARLVEPHQARIAGHVGGQYRRQPALDPIRPLPRHGAKPLWPVSL